MRLQWRHHGRWVSVLSMRTLDVQAPVAALIMLVEMAIGATMSRHVSPELLSARVLRVTEHTSFRQAQADALKTPHVWCRAVRRDTATALEARRSVLQCHESCISAHIFHRLASSVLLTFPGYTCSVSRRDTQVRTYSTPGNTRAVKPDSSTRLD